MRFGVFVRRQNKGWTCRTIPRRFLTKIRGSGRNEREEHREKLNGRKGDDFSFSPRAADVYLVVFNGMTLRHCFANYFIYIAV